MSWLNKDLFKYVVIIQLSYPRPLPKSFWDMSSLFIRLTPGHCQRVLMICRHYSNVLPHRVFLDMSSLTKSSSDISSLYIQHPRPLPNSFLDMSSLFIGTYPMTLIMSFLDMSSLYKELLGIVVIIHWTFPMPLPKIAKDMVSLFIRLTPVCCRWVFRTCRHYSIGLTPGRWRRTSLWCSPCSWSSRRPGRTCSPCWA